MLAALRHRLAKRFHSWVVARAAESETIHLAARQIYVVPTRAGVSAAATLFVMWLAAINYNLALGHALVFLLASVGIVSLLHAQRTLLGLRLSAGAPASVFAGENCSFPIVISDEANRERGPITLRCRQTEQTVEMTAGGSVSLKLAIASERRGWLPLPPLTVESHAPLGLARAFSLVRLPTKALIYPQPATSAPPSPRLPLAGRRDFGAESGDEDFAGLSPHLPGEPWPRIAWKASARQEEAPLLAKRFAGGQPVAIRLDWASLPADLDEETKIAWLTRWALDAATAGQAWELRLPGRTLALGSGHAHLAETLSALALHE